MFCWYLQAGHQRDSYVCGGNLHQLRAALLRARGGGVARLPAAEAAELRRAACASAARGVRAASGAVPAHL